MIVVTRTLANAGRDLATLVLFQERLENPQYVLRHDAVPVTGGMNSVALHQSGIAAYAAQQKRNKRQVVLLCQVFLNSFERADVLRAVVGRERHAGEHDPRAGLL